MEFGVVGMSFQQADIAIRDLAALTDTKKLDIYNRLLDIGIMQAVILSTCNRTEIYFMYDSADQPDQVSQLFIEMTATAIMPYVFMKKGKQALRYLYEVTGGYHSLVLGEDQILGQMQRAYQMACQLKACGKQLHKLFQGCFACAKRCKHEYRISEIPISIAYLAMKQVQSQTTFAHKRVLVCGSGEMAKLLITYIQAEPIEQLTICSRSLEHVLKLTEASKISYVPFDERYEAVRESDIIFSATASPHMILEKDKLLPAAHMRFFMDIASPRDIDPDIQSMEQVTLMNIDTLRKQSDEHLFIRKTRLKQAHESLLKDVDAAYAWLQKEPLDELMQLLQKYSETIADDTYQMLAAKLPLNTHEKYILQKVLHTAFLRMVKEPMIALKQVDSSSQKHYIEMMETLFKGE